MTCSGCCDDCESGKQQHVELDVWIYEVQPGSPLGELASGALPEGDSVAPQCLMLHCPSSSYVALNLA